MKIKLVFKLVVKVVEIKENINFEEKNHVKVLGAKNDIALCRLR